MDFKFGSCENSIASQYDTRDHGRKNIERIEKKINQFKKAIETNFEGEDRERIMSALDLMLYLHCEQKDRIDGKPYIIHPLEVADDLLNKYNIKDSDLIIGALLHDSVEDQVYKLLDMGLSDGDLEKINKDKSQNDAFAKIGRLYGERVKSVIIGLTNPDFNQVIKDLKLNGVKKEKNELYEEHVKEAIENPDVFVIKLSDFIRNAGNIEGHKKDHFIEKYGPVIKNVFIPAFENMSEDHPLYNKKNDILLELNNLYKVDYETSNKSR